MEYINQVWQPVPSYLLPDVMTQRTYALVEGEYSMACVESVGDNIISGHARYSYTHGIPSTITYATPRGAVRKPDNYKRISLTFRTVLGLAPPAPTIWVPMAHVGYLRL